MTPDLHQRIAHSFDRQAMMATFGARLDTVEEGRVVIRAEVRADLAQ